jgi:hypothetical protein
MLSDRRQKHSRARRECCPSIYIRRIVDPSESRAADVYFYHAPNFTTQNTHRNNGWFQDRPGMPFATYERSLVAEATRERKSRPSN